MAKINDYGTCSKCVMVSIWPFRGCSSRRRMLRELHLSPLETCESILARGVLPFLYKDDCPYAFYTTQPIQVIDGILIDWDEDSDNNRPMAYTREYRMNSGLV